MTGSRRFSLSSPDWGQAHLSLDAIVAYVDDELTAMYDIVRKVATPPTTSVRTVDPRSRIGNRRSSAEGLEEGAAAAIGAAP